MKVSDLHLSESMLDKITASLGAVKSRVVLSMKQLLVSWKKSKDLLTTIESFKVLETGQLYQARVDTGALVCSIHATNILIDAEEKYVTFEHAGKTYTEPLFRMKTAANANGVVNRPRVSWTYEWSNKKYSNIETSLADRSKLKFKLLIGRNLISDLKLPVHISKDEIND